MGFKVWISCYSHKLVLSGDLPIHDDHSGSFTATVHCQFGGGALHEIVATVKEAFHIALR